MVSFLVYSTNEENVEKKTVSDDSLPKKTKTPENDLEKNEKALQQNSSKSGDERPSNKAVNGSERNSESQEISDERTTEVMRELKSQKHKGRLGKKTFREGNRKRKRLTFKEMKELAVRKRLQRQFRGAKKEPLANLSAARLASYGLAKKKKKKS